MNRKQFSVKWVFGMTANKTQGQKLQRMGLYLKTIFLLSTSRVCCIELRQETKILVRNGNYNGKDDTFEKKCIYTEILHWNTK